MKKIPRVGVVILNWNLSDDTIKCIKSLNTHVRSCHLDIVVIDNGSKINEFNKLKILKGIDLIQNKNNLGYAKGINQGLKHFLNQNNPPEFILLMNNDAYCSDDFMELLLVEMNRNKTIGAINPMIYYADNHSKIWSSGGVIDNIRGLMSSDYYHHKSNWRTQINPYFVDWTTGCVNLIRTKVLKASGLISEELGMYVEDVEICLRISALGYKLMLVPRANVFHSVSKSTGGTGSLTARYYITRNTIIVAKKYLTYPYIFIFMNIFNQVYQSMMSGNKFSMLKASFRGFIDGLISPQLTSSKSFYDTPQKFVEK